MDYMLSCFDKTGIMARPWLEAGVPCWIVDLQHPKGYHRDGLLTRVGGDMLEFIPPRGNCIFAAFFPPCTDLAVSGSRWMKDKGLGTLIDALTLFKRAVDLAESLDAPYLIENPVNTVSTYWREPDYKFNPCDYGDPYTKQTWLWTGGGFIMPPVIHPGDLFDTPTAVEPTEGSKMHKLPPGPERANLRSQTPEGFARAVFNTNYQHTGE